MFLFQFVFLLWRTLGVCHNTPSRQLSHSYPSSGHCSAIQLFDAFRKIGIHEDVLAMKFCNLLSGHNFGDSFVSLHAYFPVVVRNLACAHVFQERVAFCCKRPEFAFAAFSISD